MSEETETGTQTFDSSSETIELRKFSSANIDWISVNHNATEAVTKGYIDSFHQEIDRARRLIEPNFYNPTDSQGVLIGTWDAHLVENNNTMI